MGCNLQAALLQLLPCYQNSSIFCAVLCCAAGGEPDGPRFPAGTAAGFSLSPNISLSISQMSDVLPCCAVLCRAVQLATNLIDRDPRWHCERQYSLQLAEGRVQLFFLDTTPFVNKYRKKSWAKYPGSPLALFCCLALPP